MLHIWTLLTDIKADAKAMDLLISSGHPQNVFTDIFLNLCSQSEDTQAILDLKCDQEHCFDTFAKQLSRKLFNVCQKLQLRSQLKGAQKVSYQENYIN